MASTLPTPRCRWIRLNDPVRYATPLGLLTGEKLIPLGGVECKGRNECNAVIFEWAYAQDNQGTMSGPQTLGGHTQMWRARLHNEIKSRQEIGFRSMASGRQPSVEEKVEKNLGSFKLRVAREPAHLRTGSKNNNLIGMFHFRYFTKTLLHSIFSLIQALTKSRRAGATARGGALRLDSLSDLVLL